MELQDRSCDSDSISKIKVESKEGERQLLSCNEANVRSPSLGFNSNAPLITEKMQLDHLAKILVGIFLEQKQHERRKQKEGSDILPCLD